MINARISSSDRFIRARNRDVLQEEEKKLILLDFNRSNYRFRLRNNNNILFFFFFSSIIHLVKFVCVLSRNIAWDVNFLLVEVVTTDKKLNIFDRASRLST